MPRMSYNILFFNSLKKNIQKSKLLLKAGFVAFILFFPKFSFGQDSQKDSLSLQKAIDNTLSFYHRFLGNENGLYNGPNYVDYRNTISDGTPFFLSSNLQRGTIIYNGIKYNDVLLLFDILKNKLVTKKNGLSYFMEFINDRVSGFTILDRRFVKLEHDSVNKIETGFYEILFEGAKTTLYKKFFKKMYDDLSTNTVKYYIVDANTYFIKKHNKYYQFFNKRTLLKAYRENRKQVRSFIRKNNIKIGADMDADMIRVAAFNDSLQ